jgi:CRP-like cAMP-binding protein
VLARKRPKTANHKEKCNVSHQSSFSCGYIRPHRFVVFERRNRNKESIVPKTRTLSASPTNRLLAALPKEEYQQLLPELEPFPLVFGEVIYDPGDLIRSVYFPTSGIISLLASVEDRATLEVGIVGREGMVGLPAFMGVKTSGNRAVVQGAGEALRMKANAFRRECENGGSFPRLLRRYTHSRLTQIAQGAACNRFHPIDARLARWLLMTSDRMGTDEFLLTQEFLSTCWACGARASTRLPARFSSRT